MEIRELLEKVQRREISTEMAEQYLKKQPFEELGFAKLDLHREVRTGFQEVVYCAGKQDAYLVSIFQKLYETIFPIRLNTLSSGFSSIFKIFDIVSYCTCGKLLDINAYCSAVALVPNTSPFFSYNF